MEIQTASPLHEWVMRRWFRGAHRLKDLRGERWLLGWLELFFGHVDAADHVEQWQGRLVVRLPRIAVEGDGS